MHSTHCCIGINNGAVVLNNNSNKRPLTQKSIPPTNNEHVKLKALSRPPAANATRKGKVLKPKLHIMIRCTCTMAYHTASHIAIPWIPHTIMTLCTWMDRPGLSGRASP